MEKRTHCTTYQQTSDFPCFRLILAVFVGSAHVCFVGKNNVTFILTLVQKSGCGTNNYPHSIDKLSILAESRRYLQNALPPYRGIGTTVQWIKS